MSDWDVIVVGGGTSGSIVAGRLADAGRRTLLLEAGGSNRIAAIQDVSRLNTLWHSAVDWDFHTVPQEHAAGRRLHLPRGRVLGGSHSLNAAIWVRCAPADFDGWAAQGADGWSWEDVEPVYRRIERWLSGDDERRGRAGPLPVGANTPLHPVQQSIMDAAVQAGLELNTDYNVGDLDGVSVQQVTVENKERVTTWDAYARPAAEAGRLAVRTDEAVTRVAITADRATGVVLSSGECISANHVVLSAGALGSAEILLRSGVGPAGHLAALRIPLIADLPVGENLHDHYLVPVVFATAREVEGPTPFRSTTQTHWFWRSDPSLTVPDTQPIAFSVPLLEPGMEQIPWGFSLMAGIVSTKSRGTLRLADVDPDAGLHIDPHVLEDERDVAAMLASVRQCLEVGAQPALVDGWGASPHYPRHESSDDELVAYIRQLIVTYHHQVGTCRMGRDERAVVDPELRVRGIEGLRVADASVMPTITTGNTNAPCAVIGERVADLLLA
ncbi:GMC family oxidoreductase [Micromonospora sp. KC606]|uniref:GMC family oxidoreductase n=1 Tax=Micromonospora sp. KC606 TaxID=2530379 RepID=UPI001042C0F3|nr:GMC family oxidoreductase [Micromonospora sp. KC606]TDC83810.1 GMC family oxidoreductase [Micromonospora sp. KC606]